MLVFGAMLFQASCSDDDEPITCTLEPWTSVVATVFDVDGSAVSDADVSYAVDGSEARACEKLIGGAYRCGVEAAGSFEIRAVYGSASKAVSVRVEREECHVITQTVSIELEEP